MLSDIARSLDAQEAQVDQDNTGRLSTNMDDTGFFSEQVLETALQVWGLTLARWRSTPMLPYHDRPHTQMAFILHLENHWFTLRRFGLVSPNPDADTGEGHWFNLNSFLEAPEWVSRLYLGMVLQQAEADGFTVFAVVQMDRDGPLRLTRTHADHLAATIPERSAHSGARLSTTRALSSQAAPQPHYIEGFEDEDMELQAALQASLLASTHDFPPALILPRASSSATLPSSGTRMPLQRIQPAYSAPPQAEGGGEDETSLDPVARSRARGQALLQHMQREQEAALRESYQEEIARFEAASRMPAVRAGMGEDEDEELRRAIAESEAMMRSQQTSVPARNEPPELIDVDEDEDDPDYEPPVIPPQPQPRSSMYGAHRVYDDEDADLQAALKASMEGIPEGFRLPSTPPRPPQPLFNADAPVPLPRPQSQQGVAASSEEIERDNEAESEAEQAPAQELSLEEIRKRRLARFGS
ncbi:hypothetical protein AcW1_008928 [Taiwanofungus camphoratus]|nr:hypothetical protein AcW1_008928 [Antrodia cinnamomea]KAI0958919.1 hypothetical protein AcV7_004601 [Antrodia cinnamomea]